MKDFLVTIISLISNGNQNLMEIEDIMRKMDFTCNAFLKRFNPD